MKLSDPEKLILIMLSEIHSSLKIKNGINSQLVQDAIFSGNAWALNWEMPGIFHDSEPTPELVTEVVDILGMWSFMERSYGTLSAKDKAQVEADAKPFGGDVRFRGFDGNNESEYLSVAGFLVDNLGRFAEFKDRDFNSHMPTIDAYRRMLKIYKPLRTSSDLSAAELSQLLLAQLHPDSRKAGLH